MKEEQEQQQQLNKGLFGSIVESVLTPGATQFDVSVINFAFISLILLLIFIFFITDRAKIHVACFLILAILTYGTIIWYLYVKNYEDEEEKKKKKDKKEKDNEKKEKKEKVASAPKTQNAKKPSNPNKNKKKKIY